MIRETDSPDVDAKEGYEAGRRLQGVLIGACRRLNATWMLFETYASEKVNKR